MFNANPSGFLSSGTTTQNTTFGSNTAPTYFGSSNGTTIPFQATDGSDSLQKNGQNISITTKLHCLTAMKAYETKSIEELRKEDYEANRLVKSGNAMFSGQPTSANPTPSMFNSFNSNQPSQGSMFGNTSQQSNTFGNKPLFNTTNTSSNSSFGVFSQTKPTSIFPNTNPTNKTLFPSNQPSNTPSIFGSPTVSSSSNLFGAQQTAQTPSFFSVSQPSQVQPNQTTNLFGSPTSSAFGFPQQSNTLFGGANKGFGNTSAFAATSSTTSAFGTTTPAASGIFGQTNTSTSMFSAGGQSLFGTPATTSLAQGNLFGNNKPATPFATSTLFPNNAAKPSVFSNQTANAFSSQPNSVFGGFNNMNSQINTQTLSTSSIVPTIGYSSPAEALLQQQQSQQKILSLVSNRPYGVNKLFLGQSLLNTDKHTTSTDSITNNTNIMSLAIKRNDTDKYGMVSRRTVLDKKTKILPNNLYKVFSGFDDEDDSSVKSCNLERHFFTKREDWKYLPPNAFDKSRSSINSSNIHVNGNTFSNNMSINRTINSNNSLANESGFTQIFSSPISNSEKNQRITKNNFHSTPIPDTSNIDPSFNVPFSPIRVGDSNAGNDDREYVIERRLGASSFERVNENVCVANNDSLYAVNKEEEIEEFVEDCKGSMCKIKLTRDGYYTAPDCVILDTLVRKNEDGEFECWVENFIIGRKSFGSIRFPGMTNVYGLNFDELVEIKRREVSVYPDEDTKPDIGDELNKRAQIILHEVWPTDKTTGQAILDQDRLRTMNFENNLRKRSEKMDARFISYSAPKGVWIFEVDHFSKYRYDESDDDEEIVNVSNTQPSNIDNVREQYVPVIVSAEADSMTDYGEEMCGPRRGLQRLFDNTNNKSVQRMKQTLYRSNDNDEDDVHSTRLFPRSNESFADSFMKKEEPQAKRFETMEMGRSMLNASYNNSTSTNNHLQLTVKDIDMEEDDYVDSRPIKPLPAEPVASTKPISSYNIGASSLKIPNHYRDIRTMKMPYLPLKLNKYFNIELSDAKKNQIFDAAMIQGNRFRVGFHMSSNEECPGLKFIRKDESNQTNISVSPMGIIRHADLRSNAVTVMNIDYLFSEYQEDLLQVALSKSNCTFNNNEDCPLWTPTKDLQVLDSYVKVQYRHTTESKVFGRIVSLCKALWADIGEKETVGSSVPYLRQLERKQALSMWIRSESRAELMKKVELVLRSKEAVDVDKCNDVILESLCCGEVTLACQLATKTKQHRMALLISQSATSLHCRAIVREQLTSWLADKTDVNIPANVMCIYVLLAGLTSAPTSDGSIITPLKKLKWYQAFGCYQWFVQPYLDSIKASLDLYEEEFKSDLDIPAPFPIVVSENEDEDYYSYYDCCYHLLKFSCDSLHDLDQMLNPPTMSRSNDHKLSLDWSSSWHLSNILSSLGRVVPSNDKLCHEWAAQLERAGQWHWAVFAVLHLTNGKARRAATKSILTRHASGTRELSEREEFVVERLQVPHKWVHAAKAVYCKGVSDAAMEAYHWLMAGEGERSHGVYVDEVWPRMLVTDKCEGLGALVAEFIDRGLHRDIVGWPQGGGIYGGYIGLMRRMGTMRATNKAIKYGVLSGFNEGGEQMNQASLEDDLRVLGDQARKVALALATYSTVGPIKTVCKQQIEAVCQSCIKSCGQIQ